MFKKVLVANRGEIACRINATLRQMGIHSVAVFSEADRQARHVRCADTAIFIGESQPVHSYLDQQKIIDAALATGAEAIHPGFGFLSENPEFSAACQKAGLVFIGPTAANMLAMASKSEAKRLMIEAGVPVVPGYFDDQQQDPAKLQQEADKVGYPLLIKAVAGGGGKGMRIVRSAEQFADELMAAKREAEGAFGNDIVLLERFVEQPRHIEFQVFGDSHGNHVHLFERECSIQRRYQKIVEETPSPLLDQALREKMAVAAVRASSAIDYLGAGTIEFIVGSDREFFFMEMNTRLQVEHPVTEKTTGVDLVEWQIRVANGEVLPLEQSQIVPRGHAIEARIYAESPDNDFLPQTGTVSHFVHPDEDQYLRMDKGVDSGDEVSVFYDPMIAKLIVWGEDRTEALSRLQNALAHTTLLGVTNNVTFLKAVSHAAPFVEGDYDTLFVDQHLDALLQPVDGATDLAMLALTVRVALDEDLAADDLAQKSVEPQSPWQINDGWRMSSRPEFRQVALENGEDDRIVISYRRDGDQFDIQLPEGRYMVTLDSHQGGSLRISRDGIQESLCVLKDANQYKVLDGSHQHDFTVKLAEYGQDGEEDSGRLTSPMPGRIVKILVAPGDSVEKGQSLMLMEAMKMEHAIKAPTDGVVAELFVEQDGFVEADTTLLSFEEEAS